MFLKTFSFRIMAIAFVGTHIPLLCIVFFCMFGPGKSYAPSEIISVTLLATLAAAMATLILVDKQVRPVRKAAIALVGVEAGTATPTMPESTCRELSQLFSAIHESYQTAQTAQEHKRQVAKKLTSQVSAADQSRQDVLDRLVKNPGLDQNERQMLYKDLHHAATYQIDSMRSIIGEISEGPLAMA